ncbi:predicted protein [Naegleria gruberi]|uniref:Predicted protein n=1 Tax=Naegleria gruberi TaxID=5762 RepID=D2VQ25_NAEGR|nr:uncharacterized protein NAEGRDRAFT_51403 [Naegleria gruberi]EFC41106.1 predicted protein [Naegleria gruberi]|eukprot:XP_002673850.1 predicted protein [Naegleria gruberi strain NEG-M]
MGGKPSSFDSKPASFESSTVDISQVVNKPITECDAEDLLVLLRHYKFEDKSNKLASVIKEKDMSGSIFSALVAPILEENQSKIEDERDRLASRYATRYAITESLLSRFIENVVITKIKRDVSNASSKKINISSIPTTTASLHSETQDPGVTPQTFYNISTAYDQDKLNEWEKRGIEKVKKNLVKYYEFLKEKKKKFETCGLIGDLEVDAQNMVCKDRFMFNTFCAPILSNSSRRVLTSEPYMQVKLIISEIEGNEIYRSIVSKVVNTEFGLLHTGLLIGEWKFDWYDNSMVSVRKEKNIGSGNAIAVIDLGSLIDQNLILSAFFKISDIVCKYNATMEYGQLNCNCQHFVSELLDALSLVTPKSKCFEKYFKNLKKGDMARKFYFSPALIDKIQKAQDSIYKKKKSIKFESRKDLDEFCFFIKDLGHFTTEEGKEDYQLLKSFDRSFVIAGKGRDGLVVVDYSVEGFKKENAFFSQSGLHDDTSITNIKYNVKDLDLSKYFLKR